MATLYDVFRSDSRINYVVEYREGFVPLSYKWGAHGVRIMTTRFGVTHKQAYDRKRSHGVGPAWVAFSSNGGRLDSGTEPLLGE